MPNGHAPFCDAPTMATDFAPSKFSTGLRANGVIKMPHISKVDHPMSQSIGHCKNWDAGCRCYGALKSAVFLDRFQVFTPFELFSRIRGTRGGPEKKMPQYLR